MVLEVFGELLELFHPFEKLCLELVELGRGARHLALGRLGVATPSGEHALGTGAPRLVLLDLAGQLSLTILVGRDGRGRRLDRLGGAGRRDFSGRQGVLELLLPSLQSEKLSVHL